MNVTAPDFSKAPPRSGHVVLGRYPWLARLADKVRADHAGTADDYIAYCGLSRGFLERAGVPVAEFDALITHDSTDEELVTYFDKHCSDAQREAASRYVLVDKAANLAEQDAEEGHA